MADFVLDASIAATWCFKDEATRYTDRLLDAVSGQQIAIAPRLWAYEVRNSALVGIRRKRITQSDADKFVRSLADLRVTLIEPISYDGIFALAGRHSLTVYDAAYLDLAVRARLPIATLDKALVEAAKQLGIAMFQPS